MASHQITRGRAFVPVSFKKCILRVRKKLGEGGVQSYLRPVVDGRMPEEIQWGNFQTSALLERGKGGVMTMSRVCSTLWLMRREREREYPKKKKAVDVLQWWFKPGFRREGRV
jgi:RNA polymerase-interacting CarD/CdnL/TRCF family regulator